MPIPSRKNTSNNINGKIFGKEMDELKRIKRARLKAILEYARDEPYTTQEALRGWLEKRGLGCNQGQLSKDLNELGMSPYIDRHGDKRLGRRTNILSEQLEERYVKVFQEAVLEAIHEDRCVYLVTLPGCGQACATVVESAGWDNVLSISYGMSSVTITCFNDETADEIYDRIQEGVL